VTGTARARRAGGVVSVVLGCCTGVALTAALGLVPAAAATLEVRGGVVEQTTTRVETPAAATSARASSRQQLPPVPRVPTGMPAPGDTRSTGETATPAETAGPAETATPAETAPPAADEPDGLPAPPPSNS
jgi:hypothetical protein